MAPQGFSASSHPSLYAGEWQKREKHGKMGRVNIYTLWFKCHREEKGSSKTDRTADDMWQKKKVFSLVNAEQSW